jgi:oligo-1,6-glucosidase
MDVINVIAKKEGLRTLRANRRVYIRGSVFCEPAQTHDYSEKGGNTVLKDGTVVRGETPFVDIPTANTLTDPAKKELDMLFQFELVDMDSGQGGKWDIIPFSAIRFKKILSSWQKGVEWNSLFLSNHDQPRPVSRFTCWESEDMRVRCATLLATVMYLQKGTPFIYQGEEIGMTNMPFEDVTELRDVESIQYYRQAESSGEKEVAWQAILKKGRDNARTPMQWNSEPNGGFTDGEPGIRVNPNYTEVNIVAALNDEDSILHYYRALIALRAANPALIYGDYGELLRGNEQVYAYTRTLGNDSWVILCNITASPARVTLPDAFSKYETVFSNVRGTDSGETMLAYEARVLHRF